jgi:hypothetical protein
MAPAQSLLFSSTGTPGLQQAEAVTGIFWLLLAPGRRDSHLGQSSVAAPWDLLQERTPFQGDMMEDSVLAVVCIFLLRCWEWNPEPWTR